MGFFSLAELQQSSRTPLSLSPKCGACGLYKTCQSKKMVPTGKGKHGVLIVGEAPGKDEDRQGKQFVGKAGKLLRDTIRNLGYDPDRDCRFTNALICHPPGKATPTNDQIDFCRPNLIHTIEEMQPDIIIPLGLSAVQSLLGWIWRDDVNSDKLEKWVGWKIPCQQLNAWICPTYHPDDILYELDKRNPMPKRFFEQHLAAAFDLEGKPWKKVPDYAQRIRVIQDVSRVPKLMRTMHRIVAFDYETNMLKPDSDKAQIVCCAVSDGVTTISYPWHGDAISATLKLLLDKRVRKIGFNMKFEERWTYARHGVRVKNWLWDGMVGSHVIDNRPGINSLKFQAFVLLGQGGYDDHIKPYLKAKGGNTINRIKEIALPDLLLYCGMDALLERKVGMKQMEAIGYGD